MRNEFEERLYPRVFPEFGSFNSDFDRNLDRNLVRLLWRGCMAQGAVSRTQWRDRRCGGVGPAAAFCYLVLFGTGGSAVLLSGLCEFDLCIYPTTHCRRDLDWCLAPLGETRVRQHNSY